MNLKTVEEINRKFVISGDPWSVNSIKDSPVGLKGKYRFKHLFLIPRLLVHKATGLLPGPIKDIVFFTSPTHKCASSKFFARTGYERLRMSLDLAVSGLVIYSAPKEIRNDLSSIMRKGIIALDLGDLSSIDHILGGVLDYSTPSHKGARPYIKGDETNIIKNSSSSYFPYSASDSKIINCLIAERAGRNLNHYISAITGYRSVLGNPIHNLSVTIGNNSNSEMHQDTWCGLAKGFLYLSDVTDSLSPFEYLKGSYGDSAFRSKVVNQSVLNGKSKVQASARLTGVNLDQGLTKFELASMVGGSGSLIIANTAGYHRKGNHNSDLPRIMLNFGFKRKGLISKLAVNIIAIFMFKLTYNLRGSSADK
jgi:hypothetical protein